MVFTTLLTFLLAATGSAAVAYAVARGIQAMVFREIARSSETAVLGRSGEGRWTIAAAALLVVAGPVAGWLVWDSPAFGLLVAFPLPLLLRGLTDARRRRKRRALEVGALTFFHTLRGLLQGGIGLPAALFQMAAAAPTDFAAGLAPFLDRFEGGRPLSLCLERFRRRAGLERCGLLLAMLQAAYAEGLPAIPLLDRMLPVLEAEHRAEERLRGLRRAAVAQAGLAALLPWGVWLTLGGFQREMAAGFRESSLFWPVIGAVAALEGIGGFVAWKISAFD